MNNPTMLDYVTAIGAIATPIIVLALTGIGWTIRNRFEKALQIEEALREDRIEIYNKILEPFIILFTKDEGLAKVKGFQGKGKGTIVSEKVLSLEYRQAAFKLALMGSDNVVRAYNNLMQYFYAQNLNQEAQKDPKQLLELVGEFLLQIRKSVGNERTELHQIEMLEWFITDIRKYKKNGKY